MAIFFNELIVGQTPVVGVETDYTGSLTALASTSRRTLLVGHKNAAATATLHSPTVINDLNDAIDKFGEGSDIAFMSEAFFKNVKNSPLYGFAYTEGTTAATETITYATNSTAAGSTVINLFGKQVSVAIASGADIADIATNVTAAINALENIPVTAGAALGVVTLTARTGGPHGNSYRVRATISSGIGTTIALGNAGVFDNSSGAAGTLVLTNAENARYHLIVSHTDDATVNTAISTHCEAMSAAGEETWTTGISASIGSSSDVTTLVSNDESYRLQWVWQEEGEQSAMYIAGAFAGLRAKTPINGPIVYKEIKGIFTPNDETKWPTAGDIETVLVGGVTPLKPHKSGKVEVVRSVVAMTTTPYYRDHMQHEIIDYATESLIYAMRYRIQGRPFKVASEPASANTVTLPRALAVANEVLLDLDRQDYLQGVQTAIDNGVNVAEVNAVDPNRIDMALELYAINATNSVAIKLSYRNQ